MSTVPFEQSLDRSRPHQLVMAPQAHKLGTLHYRYTDTGEEVRVPNVSYNQTSAGRAAMHRQRIMANETQLKRLADRTYLSASEAAHIRSRLTRMNAELETLAAAHELDAHNEGMGHYSCGNPLPDRVSFHRTVQAWWSYLEFKPQLDAAFAAIMTMEDFYEWEAGCARALEDLRAAYYFDTSDINSRSNVRLMELVNFERLMARLAVRTTQASC